MILQSVLNTSCSDDFKATEFPPGSFEPFLGILLPQVWTVHPFDTSKIPEHHSGTSNILKKFICLSLQ